MWCHSGVTQSENSTFVDQVSRIGAAYNLISQREFSSDFESWCPGPDLNRHGPVKEPQDFKSYFKNLYLSNLLSNLNSGFCFWCHGGVTSFSQLHQSLTQIQTFKRSFIAARNLIISFTSTENNLDLSKDFGAGASLEGQHGKTIYRH